MLSHKKNANPVQLDSPLYTAEEMAIVIEYKKQKRLLKGKDDLTCFALKENEFKQFMVLLKRNRSSLPENTRFQFVYEHEGHWLSGDIRIKNGKLEFFIFDSLNSVNIYLKNIISQIKNVSPTSKITYVSGSKIQTRDFRNCGTFALDHAFSMAKINDLHDQANNSSKAPDAESPLAKKFVTHVRKGTLTTLSVADFPITFGPLLRNMQSRTTLKTSFFNKGYKASNQDTLDSYFKKHKAKIEIEGEKIKINNAIEIKKEKLKTKANNFFDTALNDKKASILQNRTAKNSALFTAPPKQSKKSTEKHGKKPHLKTMA